MANIKVEKFSRDFIKPSSPTLPHLNKLQLSVLDKLMAPAYMPMIFFYQNDQSISNMERSMMLKESLSETLTHFYPLAGRSGDDFSVHCNDEGVEYYEAKVSAEVSTVVERPDLEDLKKLMPFDLANGHGRPMLGIQVNYFSCGGMAICLCASHKIVDATLYLAIIKAWATTMSRKVEAKRNNCMDLDHHRMIPPAQPGLSGAVYFPPRDTSWLSKGPSRLCKGKMAAKRLIFDTEALDELKKQASIVVGTKLVVPTRAEVVTAFIWQRIMEAARRDNKSVLPVDSSVLIVLSLRGRMVPPIPEHVIGNFIWHRLVHCGIREDSAYAHLIAKIRKATMEIDSNFIKKMQSGEFLSDLNNEPRNLTASIFERCAFTSLCRLPLYEVNFGWGRPLWVCIHALPIKDQVSLSSTKCGKGIEAWITAEENEMAILDRDPELFLVAPFRAKL